MTISRRKFNGILAASAGTLAMPSLAFGATPKVVVVGGGAGGATAARYIAKDSKGAIDVTLVEARKQYYTCFFPTFISAVSVITGRSAMTMIACPATMASTSFMAGLQPLTVQTKH